MSDGDDKLTKLNNGSSAALDCFRDKLQALATLAETQLGHAADNQNNEIAKRTAHVGELVERIRAGGLNAYELGTAVNDYFDEFSALKTLGSHSHPAVLAEIIFIAIFSSFDAFLNELLKSLFAHSKMLMGLEAREVSFGDVLKLSREKIIDATIASEIDSLLRESYSKIFDKLADRFKAGTLKKFDNWPRFIECAQRRHLITHCDGVANQQYLDNCATENVKHETKVELGDKLTISKQYLLAAIDIVAETGLKAGQVLWRCSNPLCVDSADSYLGQLIFELLKREQWTLALRMGELEESIAAHRHRRPRKERAVKLILVNYAQAAKWAGDHKTAKRLIEGSDWSGSAMEFRLCIACLKEDWDAAAGLMSQIGPNYSGCPPHAYIGWPIFREFRRTPQFAVAFKSVFGVEFAEEAGKAGDENKPKPPGTDPPKDDKESDDASGSNN